MRFVSGDRIDTGRLTVGHDDGRRQGRRGEGTVGSRSVRLNPGLGHKSQPNPILGLP